MALSIYEYYLIKFTVQYERDLSQFILKNSNNTHEALPAFLDKYTEKLYQYLDSLNINIKLFNINILPVARHLSFKLVNHYIFHKQCLNQTRTELRKLYFIKNNSINHKKMSFDKILSKNNFTFDAEPFALTKNYIDFIFDNNIEMLYLNNISDRPWEYVFLALFSNHKFQEGEHLWNKIGKKMNYSVLSDCIIERDNILSDSLLDYIIQHSQYESSLFFKKAIFNIDIERIGIRKQEIWENIPFHLMNRNQTKSDVLQQLNKNILEVQINLDKSQLCSNIQNTLLSQRTQNRL